MVHKQLLCFVFTLTLFILGFHSKSLGENQKSKIITSFPILTLITRELLDSKIEIETLTRSGEEAHHYEPSPKTLTLWTKNDLLIVNGLGFENWLSNIRKNPSIKIKILEATQGFTPLTDSKGKQDPHAWQSPEALKIYIKNIATALEKHLPSSQKEIEEKSKLLTERIQAWKIQTEILFQKIPKPTMLVTAHDSFAYLAQSFGLDNMALLGNHSDEELSPRQMSLNLQNIQKSKTRVFFGDGSQQDPILKSWAKKTNSIWGGTLWGDQLNGPNAPKSLMEYLNSNRDIILKTLINK